MPTKRLPFNPALDHLKHQAKDLLSQHAQKKPGSAQRLREFHPDFQGVADDQIFATPIRLSGAQLAVAREYGFASWSRLKSHVEKPVTNGHLAHHERIEDPLFRRAVDLIDSGNVPELSLLLEQNPGLIHRRVLFEGENYFRNPTLLEFVAENPVRHGVLPANIVEIATTLLRSGADAGARDATLQLVASGRVPRECSVQIPLIETLCANGADPNSALHAAVSHGEFEAAKALIRLGATTDLATLAALGHTKDFLDLLPSSGPEARHLAFAFAAQYGRVEILGELLKAGEYPNRYNPPGAHSHSTPLHQAALAGHFDAVRLLIESGARLDIKDLLWQGTAADWAHHGKQAQIESLLRQRSPIKTTP